MTGAVCRSYRITTTNGQSTEELIDAGTYGYAHSCLTSESFPVRDFGERREREIVLVELDGDATSEDLIAEAARRGLGRPVYEDALYFGAQHPDVQREAPIVFLHEPWLGFFGRWDVVCLWTNAGRREIGLEDYGARWTGTHRFAFVRP